METVFPSRASKFSLISAEVDVTSYFVISKVKEEIKQLGNVNMNAIEDYKEVSERYEFMNKQRNDLVEAEQTLLSIIEELGAYHGYGGLKGGDAGRALLEKVFGKGTVGSFYDEKGNLVGEVNNLRLYLVVFMINVGIKNSIQIYMH